MMSEPARQAPYDPVDPVSSSFKVMFRYIGPFVCMLLVCFLWRNTGLSRGGGGGGAAELRSDSLAFRSASSILAFRAAAPARPAATFFGSFALLF